MRQKDIRTRVAEVEAEAKGLEGIETEEEELESSNKKLQMIMALIMMAIGLYVGFALLQELKG